MTAKNRKTVPPEDLTVIPDTQDIQEIRTKDIHSEYNFFTRKEVKGEELCM